MNRRWHVKKARAPPGQVVSARPDLRRIHVNHECQPSVNRRLFEACQPVSISNRTRYNDWLSWQLPSASDPPNCHSARGCRCPLYSRGSDWNIIRSPHNETARPPPFIPVRCCCSSPRVRGNTCTTPSNYIENLAYGLVSDVIFPRKRADRALCLTNGLWIFQATASMGTLADPQHRFGTICWISIDFLVLTSKRGNRERSSSRRNSRRTIALYFYDRACCAITFRGEARREERNLHFC